MRSLTFLLLFDNPSDIIRVYGKVIDLVFFEEGFKLTIVKLLIFLGGKITLNREED